MPKAAKRLNHPKTLKFSCKIYTLPLNICTIRAIFVVLMQMEKSYTSNKNFHNCIYFINALSVFFKPELDNCYVTLLTVRRRRR